MITYMNNGFFIDEAIEKGRIDFIVHGYLSCDTEMSFPYGIKIFPPTVRVRAQGYDFRTKATLSLKKVYFPELIDETVFNGAIELAQRSREGVEEALLVLEKWADILCLVQGNPKIQIEIKIPIRAISTAERKIDSRHQENFAIMIQLIDRLSPEAKTRFESALWWYRKGCAAQSYSIFDTYAAFWNSLEILCDVKGNQVHKGETVDSMIKDYLAKKQNTKKGITSGDILHCYNNMVNFGIPQQVKKNLGVILDNGPLAEKWAFYCFHVKPEKERLYQIRNDINHGNIHENNPSHATRVLFRGYILFDLCSTALFHYVGIRKGLHLTPEKVDEYVRRVMHLPTDGDRAIPLIMH